ncbi:ABC transporter permease [Phyllobacterium sp. SB3]|uniref:ABC transporter permease n=1 Tax=Phyllobacterium sp. SB3 TaxID=3156073 RepID=UPI0032AFF69E
MVISTVRRATSGRPPLMRTSVRRGITSFIILLAMWEIVGRFVLTDQVFAVPFSAVVEAAIKMLASGELETHIMASLAAVAYGMILATAVGIVIGVLLGASVTFREYAEPLMTALYATPLVAMAPILILWFGIGIGSKVATVFLMAIFPIAINTSTGIRGTDREFLEVAHAFGARWLDVITKVMIPAAVPFVVTGLRLAVGRAIVGVVVGELFGARAGLGFLIFTAGQTFDTPALFVGVITLALIGMSLTLGIKAIETRLTLWKGSAS